MLQVLHRLGDETLAGPLVDCITVNVGFEELGVSFLIQPEVARLAGIQQSGLNSFLFTTRLPSDGQDCESTSYHNGENREGNEAKNKLANP